MRWFTDDALGNDEIDWEDVVADYSAHLVTWDVHQPLGRPMLRLALIALAATVAAGACGASGRTPGPDEYVLPADPGLVLGPGATPLACAGVGLDAVLSGGAADPRKVWLEDALTASRIELVWPEGFTVRFGQGAAFDVLNGAGTVVLTGGSHVSGGCVGGGAYWLDGVPQ